MVNSANGYPVLDSGTTGPLPRLRKWEIPQVKRHLLARDGSGGFLLIHLALWFSEEVEDLDNEKTWDDWGWAARPIRGSSTISNHASGTAIDLNATKHPMGVPTRNTFSRAEIIRIHNRLKMYTGCIRWGGDYSGRPDAMHWELDRPLRQVEKKARELCKTPRGRRILADNPGAKRVIDS